MNFLDFVLVFDFFFFFFEKTIKSRNLDMFSPEYYALHPRSFWATDRNDLQIRLKDFSINARIRKKSEKICMYSDKLTNQFWLKKVTLKFFCSTIVFTNLLITFWNY